MATRILILSEEHEKQLKALKLYKKFIKNVSTLPSGVYDKYDHDLPLKTVLSSAFVWHESPEGDKYWRKIYKSL